MSGEIWRTQGFGPVFASLLYNSVIFDKSGIEVYLPKVDKTPHLTLSCSE